MEVVRDVHLWGVLGDRFGHHHRLVVSTPAEALRAIEANRPGFLAFIGDLHADGVMFQCFRGDRTINAEQLYTPLGVECFDIAPIIRGAGENAGPLEVIAGIVLMVAGTVLTAFGFVMVGPWMVTFGSTLAFTGVLTTLLTPSAMDVTSDEQPKNRPSLFFSGAINTQAQGQPVPVLMGEFLTGSACISIGVRNEDRTREQIEAGE